MTRIQSVLRDGVFQYPTIKPITFQIGNNGSAFDITLNNFRRNTTLSVSYTKWESDINISTPFNIDKGKKIATWHLYMPTSNPQEIIETLEDKTNQNRIGTSLIHGVKGDSPTQHLRYRLKGTSSEDRFETSITDVELLELRLFLHSKRLIAFPQPPRIVFKDTLEVI